jgi:hypothetical protein
MPVDASKANPENLRQVIDAEIKSLEESIRTLKHHRNALAPKSSLHTEIITAIFSFLRLPASGELQLGGNLEWLRVAHVCHQWREIALDLPFFWSHVDFNAVSLAGATEMLARARMAPLNLDARLTGGHWDDARFSAFDKELQTRVSRICRLTISADCSRLRKTLGGLVSPAPTLEYLSLSHPRVLLFPTFVPDSLFGGTTPRLSCLKLCNCNISWKSPLLKGLKSLKIHSSSERPGLAVWMDALNEMPRLKRLILHSASPTAPPFPFYVKCTVTLPSLTHLEISDSARDCALALAHLALPALTWLCITAKSYFPSGSDAQRILQCIARHAHSPQDSHPLQSVLIRGERKRAEILAWPEPDIDVNVHDPHALLAATRSARVVLSVTSEGSVYARQTLATAMAVLPLDSLVTLTAHHGWLDQQFWLSQAKRWPLLQRVRLAPPAARGFREMLLQDNGGLEHPLLPSLKRLDLIGATLSARRTISLCDALMRRVEQGVPLEALGLSTCLATSRAVRLLSEIVVDAAEPLEPKGGILCSWDSAARGLFVNDDDSGKEDYSEDDSEHDSYTSDDDEEEDDSWMEED